MAEHVKGEPGGILAGPLLHSGPQTSQERAELALTGSLEQHDAALAAP
jgi:hypothetical protein